MEFNSKNYTDLTEEDKKNIRKQRFLDSCNTITTIDSIKIDEEEKLKILERQKRFGIVCESEDQKIQKRKERFGPINENEIEIEKKRKRAERFGIVSDDELLKKRAERFGMVPNEELLKKRAERFKNELSVEVKEENRGKRKRIINRDRRGPKRIRKQGFGKKKFNGNIMNRNFRKRRNGFGKRRNYN